MRTSEKPASIEPTQEARDEKLKNSVMDKLISQIEAGTANEAIVRLAEQGAIKMGGPEAQARLERIAQAKAKAAQAQHSGE